MPEAVDYLECLEELRSGDNNTKRLDEMGDAELGEFLEMVNGAALPRP